MAVFDGWRYDAAEGKFFNKFGNEFGSYTKKYGRISVGTKTYVLHRLAFFLHTGHWPIGEVDHIDGNTHNNKWSNLRECNRRDNAKNRRIYRKNKAGYKGVYQTYYKGKAYIHAKIQNEGEAVYLGTFNTLIEAAKCYDSVAIKLHGEYADLNFKD